MKASGLIVNNEHFANSRTRSAVLPISAPAIPDLAIVPVVPSPTDLWSTRAIEQLIHRLQSTRPTLQGVLLPNRVTRTILASDVLDVMRDFDLPMLPAALGQRNAYAQSAAIGGSVFELGSAAELAQIEVKRLVGAVMNRLEGKS